MKKLKFLLALAIIPLAVSCGTRNDTESSTDDTGTADTGGTSDTADTGDTSGTGDTSETSIDPDAIYWSVTFDTQGGSSVPSQSVQNGERAEEPAAPTLDGYIFDGWYKDTYAVTPFDFSTVITADWTIYAGWKVDLNPSTSEDSSEDPTPTPSTDAYGPDGSELVSWYIVGSGASFSGWNASGGIQMYSNPDDSTDLACILNVEFSAGDIWKLNDGSSNWIGYDNLDSSDSVATTYFSYVDDGFGGKNITVTAAGAFDIYMDSSYGVSITLHA